MKALVKIGGTLLDCAESRKRLAAELAEAVLRGIELVVVHGGGKQMTRFLAERGIESRFIDGLRVTTPETMDAVLKVLAGSVNRELVSSLIEAGAMAIGLTGIDGCLVEAEPVNPELGAVGRPVRANGALLELLAGRGYMPVVACVAGDRKGHMYNVNADQMAATCACAFGARRMVFLTDVAGVMKEARVLPWLSVSACDALIRDGVATGGMHAKLSAVVTALRNGVGEIVIAPGGETGIVARALAGENVGTRLVAEARADA